MSALAALVSVLFADPPLRKPLFVREADLRAALAHRPGYRKPSDVAFGRDGSMRLAYGDLIELREVAAGREPEPFVRGSNAAGTIELAPTGDFAGLSASVEPDDVRSVAVDSAGRTLTLHRSGALRRGGVELAVVPRGKRVRTSIAGGIAVVARTETGSSIHLFDANGDPRAVVDGGLASGGVAWSPSDERFVLRTQRGVTIHDADGARMDEVLIPTPESHHAGAVAWTKRGILALLPYALVHIQGTSVVRHQRMGAPFLSLAPMHDGPIVALTSNDLNRRGLTFVDLDTGEIADAPAAGMWPYTPIAFLPGDRGLFWVSVTSDCHLVPFGAVPRDPVTGLPVDPQSEIIARLAQKLRATDLESELQASLDELRATHLRPSLQAQVRPLVEAYATRIKDLKKSRFVGQVSSASVPAGVSVGDAVTHLKFGRGEVTAVEGRGADAKVTIRFTVGMKTLKASFIEKA